MLSIPQQMLTRKTGGGLGLRESKNRRPDPDFCPLNTRVSYDRYGNRNFVTGTGHTDTLGSCTTMCNPSFDISTNRINSGPAFRSIRRETQQPIQADNKGKRGQAYFRDDVTCFRRSVGVIKLAVYGTKTEA